MLYHSLWSLTNYSLLYYIIHINISIPFAKKVSEYHSLLDLFFKMCSEEMHLYTLKCINLTSQVDGHGEGFEELLQLYGEQLLVLWRATLLCKRILLFSPPPIGMLCSRVHSISLLGSHTTPGLPSQLLRPLYYVNIADVETLQEQHAYIACELLKLSVKNLIVKKDCLLFACVLSSNM